MVCAALTRAFFFRAAPQQLDPRNLGRLVFLRRDANHLLFLPFGEWLGINRPGARGGKDYVMPTGFQDRYKGKSVMPFASLSALGRAIPVNMP
jgi:hypothetical protein